MHYIVTCQLQTLKKRLATETAGAQTQRQQHFQACRALVLCCDIFACTLTAN